MHWTTDVLVGGTVGFVVGFGLPVLVFWTGDDAPTGARGGSDHAGGSDDDGADRDEDDAPLLASSPGDSSVSAARRP